MLSGMLFWVGIAMAVPLQVNHQGRMLDEDGAGLSGDHELIFRIFDDPYAGYIQWEETLTTDFSNGYYSVVLGTDDVSNPLDSGSAADLEGRPLCR